VASAIRASHTIWAIYAGQLPGFSRFGGWHLYPLHQLASSIQH
jgi:hypothetical protein